jgi:Flp pilus assembly protein TadD
MSVLLLAAAPPEAGTLDELVLRIDRAVATSDAVSLSEARRDVERLADEEEIDPTLARYTLAYIDWRTGGTLPHKDKKRNGLLKNAESTLRALVEADPSNAEAFALLGTVIGDQITGGWKGMTLGPKASKALDRATELEPDNPRVVLQSGISAFFTPKTFGGGIEKAEETLRRALQLFADEPATEPWPDWGRVDVYAWLGQVLAKQGDLEGAREAYRKGLEIDPEHRWIRKTLLPAVSETDARD